MKNKILLNTLVLFLLCLNIKAQNYYVKVVNKDKIVIPYVNISLKSANKHNLGWTTNEKGTFSIVDNLLSNNDSIIISCIGYNTKSIAVSNLFINKENTIILKQKEYNIEEIVVSASKIKKVVKTFGTYKNRTDAGSCLGYGLRSYYVALFLKNTEQEEGILNNVRIKLARNNHSTLPVRIHIYSVQNLVDGPQKELLFESVLASAKNSQSRWMNADLEKYRITFPKEGLFVGFEFLPTEGLNISDTTNFRLQLDVRNPKLIAVQLGFVKKTETCETWIKHNINTRNTKSGQWYYQGDKEFYHSNVGPTNVIIGADIMFYK